MENEKYCYCSVCGHKNNFSDCICKECGSKLFKITAKDKYENMSIEELNAELERMQLIEKLRQLNQSTQEKEETSEGAVLDPVEEKISYIPDSSIVIEHDYDPTTSTSPKPKTREQIINENKRNGIACCPKCGSTSISATNKKLSIGRAIIGTALLPGAGTVLGGVSSKKVICVCLSCGHKWKLK